MSNRHTQDLQLWDWTVSSFEFWERWELKGGTSQLLERVGLRKWCLKPHWFEWHLDCLLCYFARPPLVGYLPFWNVPDNTPCSTTLISAPSSHKVFARQSSSHTHLLSLKRWVSLRQTLEMEWLTGQAETLPLPHHLVHIQVKHRETCTNNEEELEGASFLGFGGYWVWRADREGFQEETV